MKQKLQLVLASAAIALLSITNMNAQVTTYPLQLDFGSGGVAAGYILGDNSVIGATNYGWQTTGVGNLDRGASNGTDLTRDLVWATAARTFQVNVQPNYNYTIDVVVGDGERNSAGLTYFTHDNIRVTINSALIDGDVDLGDDVNGGTQTETVSHTLDIGAAGTIEITLDDDGTEGTDNDGAWVLSSLIITQNSAVASVEGFNVDGYQLYPNPANDILNVVLPSGDGEVTILDVTGKVVLSASVSEDNSSVDVSALPSGIYIVNAGGRNGKFVKQ